MAAAIGQRFSIFDKRCIYSPCLRTPTLINNIVPRRPFPCRRRSHRSLHFERTFIHPAHLGNTAIAPKEHVAFAKAVFIHAIHSVQVFRSGLMSLLDQDERCFGGWQLFFTHNHTNCILTAFVLLYWLSHQINKPNNIEVVPSRVFDIPESN